MDTAIASRLLTLFTLAGEMTPARAALLFSENFESLPLGPYVSPTESGGDGTDWSDVAPAGWIRDQGATPVGSPVEFFGWTFHDRNSWTITEQDQRRSEWLGGAGTVMVADPDAYDDGTNVDDMLYNVRITTPSISLANLVANSVIINFDSSFRAEVTQIASLEVSFDGINFNPLLTYDSNVIPDGELIQGLQSISVNNGSTGSMRFRFNMLNASNDWWWAVDNISVTGDVIPEPSSGALSLLGVAVLSRRRRR